MLEVFKYEKGYWYPHMKPRDVAIWERFINAYPDFYYSCQYDVHVGDAPNFSTLMDDGTDTNQDALYKLKIDVIGHRQDGLDLIEVKPDAGASSIGQIKGYKTLYDRDEEPEKTTFSVIITDREKPNMRFLCEKEGVTLYVV